MLATGQYKPDIKNVRNPDVFMSGSPNRTSGFRTFTVQILKVEK